MILSNIKTSLSHILPNSTLQSLVLIECERLKQTKLNRIEVQHLINRELPKREEILYNQGLQKFKFGDKYIYALNLKNALRKVRRLGWIVKKGEHSHIQ